MGVLSIKRDVKNGGGVKCSTCKVIKRKVHNELRVRVRKKQKKIARRGLYKIFSNATTQSLAPICPNAVRL